MEKVALGKDGPIISRVGLGCMGMAGVYGSRDSSEAIATLRHALDIGVTLLDTADFYGPGTSEQLVGKALAGDGERAFVATKFGMRRSPEGRPYVDGSPDYTRKACDASLLRLGVDEIDLYYLARVDPNVPVEETVGTMGELVASGKVRYVGLCEVSSRTLRRAHAVHPITALQTEYSLWERHVEGGILDTVRELGVGFVAYRPLGSGFLAGAVATPEELDPADWRRNDPRFQQENFEHNQKMLNELESVAKAKGATVAQLALAWVLSRGRDIIAIPGTSRRAHLDMNVAAADICLTDDESEDIGSLFPPTDVAGTRYPEAILRTIDQD
ncbi:MAG: hypothetical protein QOH66_2471 [Actinomycetota bacterium]|jgi:aryl-alcohol dehydrogenase-like predicted oxidoreductase|nr:hypothetical protein [Actinomycetota bacterium]